MNPLHFDIKKYEYEHEKLWDDFVEKGIFGTIYHTRQFINYHPKEKFIDQSILIYYKNEVVCVVPACRLPNYQDSLTSQNLNIDNSSDFDIDPNEFTTFYNVNNIFSYLGATYGGPVFSPKYFEFRYVELLINCIFTYYKGNIEFRLPNNIYFDENIFMVYCLLSKNLKMTPELAWYIKTEDNFIANIKNKRNKSNLIKMIDNPNIQCFKTDNITDYQDFYRILKDNLNSKHSTEPTHTYEELLSLKNAIQHKQVLYVVRDDNIMLGGVLIVKVTKLCWYTFYISKNINTDNNAAIPYLMYTISIDAKKENVKYVDYGITTENKGKIMNCGLADFKERSLGGISNARYLFLK